MTDIEKTLRFEARYMKQAETCGDEVTVRYGKMCLEAADMIAALRDRIARLEKALEPFAVEGDKWAPMWEDEHAPALHPKGNVCGSCGIEPDCDVAGFTVGDLRRARAELAGEGGGK